MIVYLGLNVQIHGLHIKTREDLDKFVADIKTVIKEFATADFDRDIAVEVKEITGELE